MERRTFAGFSVVVENPAGSTRYWHDRDGRESGSTVMQYDYGFIEDQLGSDGDELDCYLGPDESSPFVHVVHQLRAPEFTSRDEDKVMLGFASEADAKSAYLAHRNDGDRAYGGMSVIPLEAFRRKLRRRTGDGKIRHEVSMGTVLMRIEHRGSKWVVLPENGDKVLGTHDTKEEAEKQLAAIEASKAAAAHDLTEVSVAPDGAVSVAVDPEGDEARAGMMGIGDLPRATPKQELLNKLRRVSDPVDADIEGRKITAIYRTETEAQRVAGMLRGQVSGSGSRWTVVATMSQLGPAKRSVAFEAARGADGKVRAMVWDRVCIPGHDEKDGESTDFNLETLSQMVENFERRGDPIPLDFNHQSNYAHLNGQPAPALAFYGALALVMGGKVVKVGAARDVSPTGSEPGLDLSRDGLWALRTEVTELGDQLLPNFKLLSPTFMPNGTERDGTEIGYCLAAVAATNTPWQSGTEITFHKTEPVGVGTYAQLPNNAGATSKGVSMRKLEKLAALLSSKFGVNFEADADDKAVKEAAFSKLEGEAAAAMSADEEKYDYQGTAQTCEDMARAYEDAHMEEDDGEAPPLAMRRMAAKFRRLAKMSEPAEGEKEKEPEMAKLEGDKPEEAKMAVMQASLAATQKRLADLEAAEKSRADAAARERELEFEHLADHAVAGGYPKEARGALIKFARTDLAGARASVAHFLPKTGAPGYLFERATKNGAPIGGETSARDERGPSKPRKVVAMGRSFVEDDADFAAEIERVADSKDPVTMAKVDKYIPFATHRNQKAYRLLAAEKIVRAERPDLAEAAE